MIRFTKLHGIGNDFVFVDRIAIQDIAEDADVLARRMCDRHKGVGADGLIFLDRGDRAPFRMTMLNPDGTNGGMCGNGVRCAARLLIDSGHQPLAPFSLEVEQRIVDVVPLTVERIRVDMGAAGLSRGEIGMMGDPDDTYVNGNLDVAGTPFAATAVSMGNPHVVIFTDDVDRIDLETAGPLIEHHALFPFRTNVHFAQVVDRGHIRMRVWERGAGITLACGSGACAVGVAGFVTGLTERKVTIQLPGGELTIEYLENGRVLMEGPAERVFEGEWLAEIVRA